jgi:hypothetical protein
MTDELQPTYQIRPARYAKGKLAVRCVPDGSGWKTLAALVISQMPGVTYSNREKSYLCSARTAAKFVAEMTRVEARRLVDEAHAVGRAVDHIDGDPRQQSAGELARGDADGGRTMNKIFVFGSNQAGRHGGGAAAYAHKSLAAQWGVGEGPTGLCYALPTKDFDIQSRFLPEVAESVERFLAYARGCPDLTFQVTRVGCGLAGFRDEEIASMFVAAPDNCEFDTAWKQWLPSRKFWGTF